MALDNAEFISELSITDPPGTDPLNQGDDHIRTTKRATQQSFPNVDAPVPQTAAQMAQMAIKNEVNTYTQQNIFQNGTALLPGIAFAGRTSTGFYASPGDRINIATSGVNRAFIDVSQFRSEVIMTLIDGSAAAPAYAFASQLDQGIYKATFNELGLAAGGVQVGRLGPGSAVFPANMFVGVGTAVTPGYTFEAQSNMGMYRSGSNVLAFSTAGVQRCTMTGTEFQYFASFRGVSGSDADAAYGFQSQPNSGMHRGVDGSLNFAVVGARNFSLKPDGEITLKIKAWHAGGTAGDLFFDLSQNFVGTDFVVGIYQ